VIHHGGTGREDLFTTEAQRTQRKTKTREEERVKARGLAGQV
jgi:hypothetical protein